jgi:hypothetical protein
MAEDEERPPKTRDDRSMRAFSKKHRVYVFREFVLSTYASSEYLQPNDVILDIAGGKGDLSYLLLNIDGYQSVVVDPRLTRTHIERSVEFLRRNPDECGLRAIPGLATHQPIAALMGILAAKEYRTAPPCHLRIFADSELIEALSDSLAGGDNTIGDGHRERWRNYWSRAFAKTEGFVTPTGKNDKNTSAPHENVNCINDADQALSILLRAKLVLGFHPDQATDFCFQLADLLNIPVCVVPCCVFPSEFPHRRFYCDVSYNELPVKRYQELLMFLQQQHSKLQTAVLDFPGTITAKNLVLYTMPPSSSAIR